LESTTADAPRSLLNPDGPTALPPRLYPREKSHGEIAAFVLGEQNILGIDSGGQWKTNAVKDLTNVSKATRHFRDTLSRHCQSITHSKPGPKLKDQFGGTIRIRSVRRPGEKEPTKRTLSPGERVPWPQRKPCDGFPWKNALARLRTISPKPVRCNRHRRQ